MLPDTIRAQLEDDRRNHRATALTAISVLVADYLEARMELDVGAIDADEPGQVARARVQRVERAEDALRLACGLPSTAEVIAAEEAEGQAALADLEEMGVTREMIINGIRKIDETGGEG